MEDPLLLVKGVSKRYNLSADRRRALKGIVIRAIKREKSEPSRYVTVLENVSFAVSRGDVIGVIGENGTGKSTLLKIISGILQPDSGKIEINGNIAPLLEIGLGFSPELTGRENALLYGSILGLTNSQTNSIMDGIAQFAELESFMDVPMRKYSSGMQMRLAFSVAMNVNPDIVLLDEVFSVGDQRFQAKSFSRLEKMINDNKAVLLVSHDANVIKKLCTKLVFLKKGGGMSIGDVQPILKEYNEFLRMG